MVLPWSGIALADLIRRFRAPPVAPSSWPSRRSMIRTVAGAGLPCPGAASIIPMWRLAPRRGHAPSPSLPWGSMARPCLLRTGAPIRLVVPWKYGFKSIKSIVSIRLVEEMPPPPGTRWPPTNMASTPTSTRAWITRAGARRASVSSARGHLRGQAPADPDVQWLWRRGGVPLRDGSCVDGIETDALSD